MRKKPIPKTNLKLQREKANLPQRYVSQKLGFLNGSQTISDYETGRREPLFETLIKMAELYGCTVNDFVDKEMLSEGV